MGNTLYLKNIIVKSVSLLSNNRQAAKSIVALIGSNMTSSLLSAVGGLLIAHFIGPEVTGLYRSYTIPLTYLTFLHLGTFDGLWRQIPFYIGKNMPEKVTSLASAAGAWNLVVSTLVSCGFLLFAIYSFMRQDLNGMAGWLSQAICCWGVFYGGYLGATYRTINQFTALARIQLIQAILNFVSVSIIPVFAFYGLCIRAAVAPVAGVWLSHHKRPMRIPYGFDLSALKEVVSIGLPFCLMGSLYTSVWVASESALILALGGIKGLGFFSVAVVIREGMLILPQAVHQVLSPRIVEKYSRTGSIQAGNAHLSVVTIAVTCFMVIIVLLMSVLVDFIVPLVIPKYIEGISLIKVCLWFSVLQAAALPLNSLFATGNWWIHGRGIILGLVVFPLSAYLLTSSLGGEMAVVVGSLLGRSARTLAAYLEIFLLTRAPASCIDRK